jgi:hypothetical protein
MLDRRAQRGPLPGKFQLDEQETFETDRRLMPVTVPVLIERYSFFVVHAEAVPMGPRGRLSPSKQARRIQLEERSGKRWNESSRGVLACFKALRRVKDDWLDIETDKKRTYRPLLHRVFERLAAHATYSSKLARTRYNPLFPINLTLAMMRDGISRLVRRTWAHAKLRARLADHIWIWIGFRNYVRNVTNDRPGVTPAMLLEVARKPWTPAALMRWRPEFLR